ncbi:MAG: cytochrome c biogenesis protein ResB, partial [Prevotella sp.]
IDVRPLAFPVGGCLCLAAMAGLYVAEREAADNPVLCRFRSAAMATRLLGLTALACVVGGCLPQRMTFQISWPFVVLLVAVAAHLWVVLLHRLIHGGIRRNVAFVMTHGGLLLALLSGMAGAGDMSDMRLTVDYDNPASQAVSADGRMRTLGYTLQLANFSIVNDATGGNMQYEAEVMVDNKPVTLRVNSPHAVRWGEDIYLQGFDTKGQDGHVRYVVLQVVRHPWKYSMCAGLLLMFVGIVMMTITRYMRQQG